MPINLDLTNNSKRLLALASAVGLAVGGGGAAVAQSSATGSMNSMQAATYADLVTLSEQSDMVIRAKIRRQTEVDPVRAPGLKPGFARLFIEAETMALISGDTTIGEDIVYLVDVPRDAKGKVPKLKKREFILFANALPNRPITKRGQEIQLADPDAQIAYTPEFEQRVRPVLTSLASGRVPPRITGVADALAVEGTLAGESETQIFLETADRSPVSISVLRRPGQNPVWGVSWGEIIDSSARAPRALSLDWYRLACSLPTELPSSANLARDPQARRLAASDYGFVMSQLGPCTRVLTD